MTEIETCLADAINKITDFVEQTTGEKPTPDEIANALKRYFVLNEIKEHILMERNQET